MWSRCFLTKARPAVLPKCVRVNVCRTSSKMRRVCPADVSQFQAVMDGGGAGILPDEAGGKFEGWLEPGSYNVQNKSAEDIIKEMVDARVSKLDSLGVPTGSERERILNIASIAEAEVGSENTTARWQSDSQPS